MLPLCSFICSSMIPAGIQLPDLCHRFDSCSIWNHGGLREWILGCRHNSVLISKLPSLSWFDTIGVNLLEVQAQMKAQEKSLLLFVFSEQALNFSAWPTKKLRVVTKITGSQDLCRLHVEKKIGPAFRFLRKNVLPREYGGCYRAAVFPLCAH